MPVTAALPASARAGASVACAHDRRLGICSRHHAPSLLHPRQSSARAISARSRPPISVGDKQLAIARKLAFVVRAADSTQPATAGKAIIPDDEFSLAKVSFGVIGLGVGVSLLSYGFGAYFNILPGSEWSALMLTYGFPLTIIGMALKYAELKPVPCLTYSDAQILRENCATPILKQVRSDVIRYRYGDEQHLDEALKRIFQYGQGGGIPRRSAPILQMIREEVTDEGKYCLVLVFEAKALQLSDFEQRQAKFASFFGPGISAEVAKGEQDLYEVRLISNTTPNASS
ncbi:thylakoid membrane protein slr0575 isoform X2 [Rhodamnia argentea]|uniref:Thylakoid membrane protein slr0575 isoform X2 n=1 Tax=Rhodamnia argentea TaxID=178133 RepID=A0A8B8NU83_9MYRT|nr:thylakoid membrane protein slr0575 isoform X2 [Rhodamnia argentea]